MVVYEGVKSSVVSERFGMSQPLVSAVISQFGGYSLS